MKKFGGVGSFFLINTSTGGGDHPPARMLFITPNHDEWELHGQNLGRVAPSRETMGCWPDAGYMERESFAPYTVIWLDN